MLSKTGILSRIKVGNGGEAKTERHPLSKDMLMVLPEQFSSLVGQDLSGFTFEQRRSSQPGAKFDLSVYDASGMLRYDGRKFEGAQGISFWKHTE